MSNKLYDILKKFVQLVLPAAGTLYFTLASVWGLPAAEQVVATLAAIATFLGVVLQLSSNQFNKVNDITGSTGDMVITRKPDGGLVYTYELNEDPLDLAGMNKITFNVKTQDEAA